MRGRPTPAELRLLGILNSLNDGVLRGRFDTQHVVSGRWIVDFFFSEIRLAIEVDGAVHQTEDQKTRDLEKEQDCARFDITLLRITNADVFGDRDKLVDKLRHGWRMALKRENQLIGKEYCPSKPT
jgi:very-short-patch-repair endonuclease